MTATAAAPRQLAFDPNHYLDCRRLEWKIYEGRGLVRFERPTGSKTPVVLVDDVCVEVLAALRALRGRDHWALAGPRPPRA
jgi:hypothetical protein